MCPFEGSPEGFSAEALASLDRALQCMWDDMVLAQRGKAATLARLGAPMSHSNKPTVSKHESAAGTTGRPVVRSHR